MKFLDNENLELYGITVGATITFSDCNSGLIVVPISMPVKMDID